MFPQGQSCLSLVYHKSVPYSLLMVSLAVAELQSYLSGESTPLISIYGRRRELSGPMRPVYQRPILTWIRFRARQLKPVLGYSSDTSNLRGNVSK